MQSLIHFLIDANKGNILTTNIYQESNFETGVQVCNRMCIVKFCPFANCPIHYEAVEERKQTNEVYGKKK